MPRDKKTIHRATSDIEDEVVTDEEEPLIKPVDKKENIDLIEERKKFLKDIILRRNMTLKQQNEKYKQQQVTST